MVRIALSQDLDDNRSFRPYMSGPVDPEERPRICQVAEFVVAKDQSGGVAPLQSVDLKMRKQVTINRPLSELLSGEGLQSEPEATELPTENASILLCWRLSGHARVESFFGPLMTRPTASLLQRVCKVSAGLSHAPGHHAGS